MKDEPLPFTAPDYGDYRIAGQTYRLGRGTTVSIATMPELDPLRGCHLDTTTEEPA